MNSSTRSAPMNRPALSLRCATVIALAACCTEPTEPTHVVFLFTDAREYQLPAPSAPPMAIFATISNQTFATVPVRRCLIRGSSADPVGADLVFERAHSEGAWRAGGVGLTCLSSSSPGRDGVLAAY